MVEGAVSGGDWDEGRTTSLEQIKSEILQAAIEFVSAPRHGAGRPRSSREIPGTLSTLNA